MKGDPVWNQYTITTSHMRFAIGMVTKRTAMEALSTYIKACAKNGEFIGAHLEYRGNTVMITYPNLDRERLTAWSR